jgi:hypothetical protein
MSTGTWKWKDAGTGAVGGVVAGIVGLLNPCAGGAAGSFVTGVLSGDPPEVVLGTTLVGGVFGQFGASLSKYRNGVEGALIAIDADAWGNVFGEGYMLMQPHP